MTVGHDNPDSIVSPWTLRGSARNAARVVSASRGVNLARNGNSSVPLHERPPAAGVLAAHEPRLANPHRHGRRRTARPSPSGPDGHRPGSTTRRSPGSRPPQRPPRPAPPADRLLVGVVVAGRQHPVVRQVEQDRRRISVISSLEQARGPRCRVSRRHPCWSRATSPHISRPPRSRSKSRHPRGRLRTGDDGTDPRRGVRRGGGSRWRRLGPY